jgi:hypothetical protein
MACGQEVKWIEQWYESLDHHNNYPQTGRILNDVNHSRQSLKKYVMLTDST